MPIHHQANQIRCAPQCDVYHLLLQCGAAAAAQPIRVRPQRPGRSSTVHSILSVTRQMMVESPRFTLLTALGAATIPRR